jgi:aminoglycoside phosphotransferase (APT) family kinase protein
MLLTETNMIYYLLGRGLTDSKNFVQGRYSCHSSEGRHRHFIINKEFDEQKLFIKQAPKGNAEKTAFLLKEGLFYKLISSEKKFEELKPYMPAVLFFDANDAVLSLEYYSSYAGLDVWLHTDKNENAIRQVSAELAAALFSLHSISRDNLKSTEEKDLIAATRPWVLDLAEIKNENYSSARSVAEKQSAELIFSIPGFDDLIRKAAQQWQVGSIIHGDCKLSNFLFEAGKKSRLKWIDWEIVTSGDPLWDVATVFQSALSLWTISNDPGFISANKQILNTENLQLFISSLWGQYADHNQWDAATAKQKLEKCTGFTALRLLHACFETTPAADNLQPYSARLLQLAYNIIADPVKATEELFGINTADEK